MGQLPLILASASRGRRELMKSAGYSFTVEPANIDEPDGCGVSDIRRFVQEVSWRKAAAVAPSVERGIVIAADSVGWTGDEVIGKPADEADARRILKTLSGTDHELWTGVTLWRRPDDAQFIWQEFSTVHCRAMTEDEIDVYLKTRPWQGCSGAYAVQMENDPYVTVKSGSISNVVGLPLESLAKALALLADND